MNIDYSVILQNFIKGVSLVLFSPVGVLSLIVCIVKIAKKKSGT